MRITKRGFVAGAGSLAFASVAGAQMLMPIVNSANAASFALPTPPFGSTNLVGWWDATQTYTNALGVATPSIYYDTVGYNTVSAWEDLSGNGNGWWQPNKALQPNEGNYGPLFDSGTVQSYMNCQNLSFMAGLSQFSVYAYARPIAGTAKRTLLYVSEASTTTVPTAASVQAGGALYQVGDYVTTTGGTGTKATVQVTSISGGGVVTGVALVVPGSYTVVPSNPVAQGSTSNPAGTAVGTGLTVNLTFPPAGSGSGSERFANYFAAGSTSRKRYVTTSAADGAQNSTSTSNGTSWGAVNGAALTDTTTFHSLGIEVDYTGALNTGQATANFYYDSSSSVDGSSQLWTPAESQPWALNTSPSALIRLGNNSTAAAALQGEILAMVVLAEIPTQTRRAQILSYFAGLP